jgi:hypothetical protein
MNSEVQEKLKKKSEANPVDEVLKTILKSQAECCVRAQKRLNELENNYD